MPRAQAVFLDFDGVVLESVGIKTEAFRELFSVSPEHVEAAVRYHVENGGVPRREKFRYFYEELLRRPVPEGAMDRLDAEFSRLVVRKILACPFVPGAREFLESSAGAFPLFVVSATPEPELRRIVEARGLARFFAGVYGSPLGKAENLRRVVAERGFEPGRCVFVGDAAADFEASRAVGLRFIARDTPEMASRWAAEGVLRIPDLSGLSKLVPAS
ncbi:HAD family hydrolase [bacterium]|nr:MAG: HAD family hydrolase [bacterium]